jgi:hypothetical protein
MLKQKEGLEINQENDIVSEDKTYLFNFFLRRWNPEGSTSGPVDAPSLLHTLIQDWSGAFCRKALSLQFLL